MIGLLLPFLQVLDLFPMSNPALASEPRDRMDFRVNRSEQQPMIARKPTRDLRGGAKRTIRHLLVRRLANTLQVVRRC